MIAAQYPTLAKSVHRPKSKVTAVTAVNADSDVCIID